MKRLSIQLITAPLIFSLLLGSKSVHTGNISDDILKSNNIISIPSNKQAYWTKKFPHNIDNRLNDLSYALIKLADQNDIKSPQLDNLLYYLRAYSYFGPWPDPEDEVWSVLNSALNKITRMPGFYKHQAEALRLQEHYLVSIYRYYTNKELAVYLKPHNKNIIRILNNFSGQGIPKMEQAQYTLWEAFRTISFLAYDANHRAYVKENFKHKKMSETLLEYSQAHFKSAKKTDWIIEHSLWTLARIHTIADEKQKKHLDQQVKKLISSSHLEKQLQKELFTQRYLVNSFRRKSECKSDFKDLCFLPSIDKILTVQHRCSDSILIKAYDISSQQLKETCKQLTSQEKTFHKKLATREKPVANDFNDTLEVIVFDNYGQYNQYASLEFDIDTQNGGMYLEGTPSDPKNTARFIAFETEWIRPKFGIWNLKHEYVHYIDGRYVKYGAYGNFEKNVTWWAEGLANYIAEGDYYKRASRMLHEKNDSSQWPTLEKIFATEYSDGLDLTYGWSYLAIKFLDNKHPNDLHKLAYYMKTDYFDGYMNTLKEIQTKHQQEFTNWVLDISNKQKINKKENPKKQVNRRIYYELYRHYLQEISPPLTVNHNHNINL